MHCAGAALGDAAAEVRIVQAEIIAQCIEQRHVRIGLDAVRLAVDVEGDFLGHGGLVLPGHGRPSAASSANSPSFLGVSALPGPHPNTCRFSPASISLLS